MIGYCNDTGMKSRMFIKTKLNSNNSSEKGRVCYICKRLEFNSNASTNGVGPRNRDEKLTTIKITNLI